MSGWAEYLGNTGWDTNSPLPQDPLFLDPDSDDFHLQEGSAGIDAGVDVGPLFHGPAPDIGVDSAIGTIGVVTH